MAFIFNVFPSKILAMRQRLFCITLRETIKKYYGLLVFHVNVLVSMQTWIYFFSKRKLFRRSRKSRRSRNMTKNNHKRSLQSFKWFAIKDMLPLNNPETTPKSFKRSGKVSYFLKEPSFLYDSVFCVKRRKASKKAQSEAVDLFLMFQ